MIELEKMNARESISVMRNAVINELDDLHRERRDHLDVIKSQEKQLKMMRESVEYATDLKMQAHYRADFSFFVMYMALVSAFVAIGYAVCFG